MSTTYVKRTNDIWKDLETAEGFGEKLIHLRRRIRNEMHLVVYHIRTTTPPILMAVVVYVDNKGTDIGFKSVDEGMEPYNVFKFPKYMMDCLSPVEKIYNTKTTQDYARSWRKTQLSI